MLPGLPQAASFHMLHQVSFYQDLNAVLGIDHYFDRFQLLGAALVDDNLQDLHSLVIAIGNHQSEMASQICQSHIRRFNEAIV